MTDTELISLARQAMARAYAPYSGFQVGAALLAASGRVYLGCNLENASYLPTICAERTAFAKAVSEGERAFTAIAVVGGERGSIPAFARPAVFAARSCGNSARMIFAFCSAGRMENDGNLRFRSFCRRVFRSSRFSLFWKGKKQCVLFMQKFIPSPAQSSRMGLWIP